MSRFFSVENPVMPYFALLRDWIILSALWSVCSLPIITAGTATASVYYVTLKMVRQERVSVTKAFFHAFRDNLKQGVALTVLFILCVGVLGCAFAYATMISGVVKVALVLCVISFLASVLCLMLYSFPFMAQFSNSVPGILKSAAYLAGKNLTNTILMLLLNMIPVWVLLISFEVFMRLLPIWAFMLPGTAAYLCSMRLRKIFDPLIAAIRSRDSVEEEKTEV